MKNQRRNSAKRSANEATVKTNSVQDVLKSTKHENSNKMLQALKKVINTILIIRRQFLAIVAESAELSQFSNEANVKLLRKSKRDAKVYQALLQLAEFRYSRIVEKVKDKSDKITYIRAYSLKSLLYACDVYLSNEQTTAFFDSVEQENIKKAIERAKKAVITAQNKCNTIQRQVERLQAIAEDKRTELDVTDLEQAEIDLKSATTQLSNATTLSDYVSIKANRALIVGK